MIQRLLLLPGMDGTGELFAEFVRALPEGLNAKTLVYPPNVSLDYRQLMELVGSEAPSNEPFVVVAESFSTTLAIAYAASRPANLKGLVMCAGFAASPVKGWKRALALGIGSLVPIRALPSSVARSLLVSPDSPKALIAQVRAAIQQVRPEVLRHRLESVLGRDEREALAKVSIPILYLRAKRDRLVPVASLEEMLHVNPEMQIAEIDGPHLLLQAMPKASAEVVMQFVRRLD